MSAATKLQSAQPPTPRRKHAAAATVLGRVFGEEVLAALHEGVLKGDLTGIIPLLTAATAKPYLRAAVHDVFAAVCDAGEVDAAALLLEGDGIDGNAALNPGYVRPTHDDKNYGYAVNDESDEEGDTALTHAARRGRSGIVRALVASGKVDPNRAGPNGGRPLVLAIRSKDTACVEALLSADGIDANAAVNPAYLHGMEDDAVDGDTVLVRAAREGNAGAVRVLVESGKADVSRAAPNGELPLVQAIVSGDAACMEVLLCADGINTGQADGECWTPLIAAAHSGNAALVQRLLRAAGAAVNHANEFGDTALTKAAQKGHGDCVRALLNADGVAVNHANEGGITALLRAAFGGHVGCVRALLQADGVDANIADAYWGPPLLTAIRRHVGGWEACARALASAKGIDLNHRHQDFGRTVLHEVCARKHAALAEHLLIAGGCRFALTTAGHDDYYQPTKAGDTALALAAGDKAITKVFASGVDYWRRGLHSGHGWAMKEAVRTLLLVRQRLDANALAALPHLPEEIWLAALGFLRSADFMPPN